MNAHKSIAWCLTLALLASFPSVSSAHGAQPGAGGKPGEPGRWSHQTIGAGRVSLPVTVFIDNRPIQATFSGFARKGILVDGTIIDRPRIVANGKRYYLSQNASSRLFRDFSAPNSGQTLVWGSSLTRNPQLPILPSLGPALIDYVNGKLKPAGRESFAKSPCLYYNGPDGYLGRGPSTQDHIGLVRESR